LPIYPLSCFRVPFSLLSPPSLDFEFEQSVHSNMFFIHTDSIHLMLIVQLYFLLPYLYKLTLIIIHT
jgi:hypothetical protein